MSHLNTTFDNDMDSFLNLPQDDFTPASTSPNTQTPQLATQPPQFASTHQTFSGPSFQYDAYRQQTGLPVGGLANTFAVNQNAGLQHWDGQGSFVMPSESINLPLSKVEDFDFSRMDDLDFDADSPTIFGGSQGQFVSPTTLVSNASSSSTMQRIYPGMHSQAAQAKAQQAKQQQEMIRQQQQQQVTRPLPAGQKPLPKGQPAKDPRVEESISRILNQMRQKSTSSDTKEEDSPSPNMSSMPRSKKDEEDMDEDERLLASEEGKKLSSKERRQLRNKVSARAFRSRRKEYIGQLEGDLNAKADENSALRTENQQLREENNRLTDLTRMLLSSQAFSGFLQELSQSGVPPPTQQRQTQQPTPERSQHQHQRKDVNPHDAARQMNSQQPQVGMALMPETNVDLSLFGSWNSGVNTNDFQVFAVTELPEDPVLDLTKLSEKPAKSSIKSDSSKLLPSLPELPAPVMVKQEAKADAPTIRLPVPAATASPVTTSSPTFSLVKSCTVRSQTASEALKSPQDLDSLCAELEETYERLAALLPRIPIRTDSSSALASSASLLASKDSLLCTTRTARGQLNPRAGRLRFHAARRAIGIGFVGPIFNDPSLRTLHTATHRHAPESRREHKQIGHQSKRKEHNRRGQSSSAKGVTPIRSNVYEAFYGINALIWRLVKKMAPPKVASASERQQYGMQILTTPTADTPGTTIALSFDSKRYLFGHLSEGSQRSFIQRGFGMRKLRNMFLTGSTNWKTNGGLLGFVLTLADVQAGERSAEDPGKRLPLHIHGSPMLLHTLATARRFIFRTGMPLTIQESTAQPFKWPSDPTYTDENIRVWSIPVRDADAAWEHNVDAETSEIVRHEQTTRAKVVNDMFDSEWRRDRLIESPFKDVKLPAMVFIRDPDTKELKGYHCPNHESAPHIQPDQTVLVRNPWPASLVTSLPPTANLPCNVSMSYIVRGHQQRGQLDPKKAIALGVKPGPLFSELTAGRSVQAADGTTVTSEQVLGLPRASKGMAVFDLPTPGHLRQLHEILTSSPPDVLQDVSVAVWILGPGVASEEQFHQLLKTFDKLQHLVSDVDSAPNKLAFETTALSTARLAKINPTNYRIPLHNDKPYGEQAFSGASPYAALGAIPVEAGMKIGLEPKHVMTREDIPDADLSQLEMSITSASNLQSETSPGRPSLPSESVLTEPEITTLGTGSSQPSKYRNVSATLVRLPQNQGNFLLDCGENTLGQLRRAFPAEELQEILRNLQGIWISHLHADHHLGTVSVLQERAKAFDALGPDAHTADRTIYLMSEKGMIDWIQEYSSVEPSLLSSTGLVLLVCNPTDGPTLGSQPFDVAASSSALQRVQSVRVSHCAGAQAVSITFKSGFKISYSGDCRPSSEFCRIGLHSDVLVHEATFDDDMQGDAWAKKHSTTAEALGVALKMKAKNVLLTHFSQRYSKLPNLSSVKAPEEIHYEEGTAGQDAEPIEADGPPPPTDTPTREQQQKTGASTPDQPSSVTPRPGTPLRSAFSDLPIAIAFDFMRIKVSEIAAAKQYYPAIQAMFDQQEAISDERREAARKAGEANVKTKNGKKMGWQQEKGTGKKSQNNNKGSGKRAQQIEGRKRRTSSSNGELVSSSSADKLAEPQQGRKKMLAEEKPMAMPPPPPPPPPQPRTPGNDAANGAVTVEAPLSKRAQKRAAKRAAADQMTADADCGGGKRIRSDG